MLLLTPKVCVQHYHVLLSRRGAEAHHFRCARGQRGAFQAVGAACRRLCAISNDVACMSVPRLAQRVYEFFLTDPTEVALGSNHPYMSHDNSKVREAGYLLDTAKFRR